MPRYPGPCFWISASVLSLLFCAFVEPAFGQAPHPVIQYVNGLGGSSTDNPLATAIDSAGNLYIAGQTTSANYPATHRLVPYQSSFFAETFVTKVDATGSQTVFSTIIGIGKPSAMTVDASGDVLVAGVDASSNIPATPGAFS